MKPEVKPKVKVEKTEVKSENGNVKIEKGKEDLQKEYYVFINGEKRLVRLVAEESKGDTDHESDSSIKETKKPTQCQILMKLMIKRKNYNNLIATEVIVLL